MIIDVVKLNKFYTNKLTLLLWQASLISVLMCQKYMKAKAVLLLLFAHIQANESDYCKDRQK